MGSWGSALAPRSDVGSRGEILQSFYIPSDSLEDGFLVRKVRLSGSPRENGAIEIEIQEIPEVW